MSNRTLALVMFLGLAGAIPALASIPTTSHASEMRLAQAEQEFQATEAPKVKLEEPENLERSGEPVPGGEPSAPPPAPSEQAPVPEWWQKAQQSLDQAIDARTSDTGENAESTNAANTAPENQRTLGRTVAQGVISLCVVLALILFCTWAVKRFGARTPLLAGTSLGTVLGKVYLTPKVALHFVKVRNVVLVIAVTPTGVSSIAQLNAALFDDIVNPSPSGPQNDRQLDFLSHLTGATKDSAPVRSSESEDDEIAALKGDIARLQQYLQETTRELGD